MSAEVFGLGSSEELRPNIPRVVPHRKLSLGVKLGRRSPSFLLSFLVQKIA